MSVYAGADRWCPLRDGLPEPPEHTRIDWMDSSGAVTYGGTRVGGLYYLPSGMYVYYVPVFWRLSAPEQP